MDKYHTNKPPAGDPIVMPGTASPPSQRPQPMATDTASTADKYIPRNGVTPNPAPAPAEAPPQRLSKLSELADLVNDLPSAVDNMAGDAITRLLAAKQAADSGVGKINRLSQHLEDQAKKIEDFATKISNVPL